MSEIKPIEPGLLSWLQSKDDVTLINKQLTHNDLTWYIDRQASIMQEAEIYEQALKVGKFTIEQMKSVKDFLEGTGKHVEEEFIEAVEAGDLELIGQYTQPEIFLSPEPTIRWMTKLGREKARQLGGNPPHLLDLKDTFGFPEIIPDIMHELGQKTFHFKRGFDGLDEYGAVFYWEGPGGNKILAAPYQGGYDNAVHLTTHGAERKQGDSDEDYLNKRIGAATLRIVNHLNRYGERFRSVDLPYFILMDGSDFTRPDEGVEEVLAGVEEKMRQDYGIKGLNVRAGSLGEYSELIQKNIKPELLRTYKGEMRSGREHVVLRGIDSTRMYLKQKMHRAGTRIYDAGVTTALSLMARTYANPLYGDQPLIKNNHKTRQLTHSYESAIEQVQIATSHDAVPGCGCSKSYIEHEHAMDSSRLRADQTVRNAIGTLAERHDTYGSYKFIERTRGALNLLPFRRTSLVEVPLQDALDGVKGLRAFTQTDDGEVEIPVQITLKQDIPYATYVRTVDGLSSADVRFEPIDEPDRSHHEKPFDGEFENEFYKVEVLPNGALNITDKLRGTSLSGLVFEEQGDRGDEYNFCPIDGETPADTTGGHATITVLEDGPVFTEIRIDTMMVVPRSLDGEEGAVREVETRVVLDQAVMPISTKVRLIKGIDRVEFQTTIDNTARDHRVRVRFDTPNAGATVRAREPYTMTTRKAVPIKGGKGWMEPHPIATSHHQGLVTAGDLAVYTRGLPEYEALTDADGTINQLALTLFRGVGYLSRGNLSTRPGWAGPGLATPDAQMLGPNTYEYAISLRGAEKNSDIIRRADDYIHPIEDGFQRTKMNGTIGVDSDGAIVSEIFPTSENDAVIVVLYNPNDEPTEVKIDGIFKHAVRANGDGEKIDDADMREFVMERGITTIRLS